MSPASEPSIPDRDNSQPQQVTLRLRNPRRRRTPQRAPAPGKERPSVRSQAHIPGLYGQFLPFVPYPFSRSDKKAARQNRSQEPPGHRTPPAQAPPYAHQADCLSTSTDSAFSDRLQGLSKNRTDMQFLPRILHNCFPPCLSR